MSSSSYAVTLIDRDGNAFYNDYVLFEFDHAIVLLSARINSF